MFPNKKDYAKGYSLKPFQYRKESKIFIRKYYYTISLKESLIKTNYWKKV